MSIDSSNASNKVLWRPLLMWQRQCCALLCRQRWSVVAVLMPVLTVGNERCFLVNG
jgi:hypothetical protein